jgi:basic amino acid/polyamine antiporter, APA family
MIGLWFKYVKHRLASRSGQREPSSMELRRQLGLASLVMLVVGEVVGVGIFLTPAQMARSLGSPFWLLVVWLLMGLMALCGALCYGALAGKFPEAGGGYVYLREAWGQGIAFLYGWKCLFVLDPGLTAAFGVGLASYAAYIAQLAPLTQKLLAIAAILSLGGLNVLGLRLGAGFTRWLSVLKLSLLGFLIVWGVLRGLGDWSHLVPFVAQRPGSLPLRSALAAGMVSAFFSFAGWWDAAKVAGEARDPARTVPRALLLGVSIVTLVYILTTAAFLYLVPLERVTTGEAFAAQAGEALFGPAGATVFSVVVMVSVLGSLASFMTAAPRVYYAMARDGVFLRAAGVVHPRFGTPARAILIQAGLASLLVALGNFEQIVAYFIFVTVLFVALTVAAVLRVRPRASSYSFAATVFLALALVLLLLLAVNNPWQALLGTAVVALGWPVYRFGFRASRAPLSR